jgi:hypothetical protein
MELEERPVWRDVFIKCAAYGVEYWKDLQKQESDEFLKPLEDQEFEFMIVAGFGASKTNIFEVNHFGMTLKTRILYYGDLEPEKELAELRKKFEHPELMTFEDAYLLLRIPLHGRVGKKRKDLVASCFRLQKEILKHPKTSKEILKQEENLKFLFSFLYAKMLSKKYREEYSEMQEVQEFIKMVQDKAWAAAKAEVKEEGKIELARKLVKDGIITKSVAIKYTGLTEEEFESALMDPEKTS